MSLSHADHRRAARDIRARCAVVTLSDSRTAATDASGDRIVELLAAAGHKLAARHLIPDEPQRLRTLLDELLADGGVDAVITTGGTGISRRDQTVPVIAATIESPLPGFGELFRMLSYAEIGSAALLSRALAGVARGKPIFALPGSRHAVELALTKLILPELPHLLGELRR